MEIEVLLVITTNRFADKRAHAFSISVCIAQMMLQHYHFDHESALFDRAALSNAHVLELGYES